MKIKLHIIEQDLEIDLEMDVGNLTADDLLDKMSEIVDVKPIDCILV
jgi:hypothetical protein